MAASQPEHHRGLLVMPERCTGCRVCEMICALRHEGASAPHLSRIRVVKVEEWNLNFPVVCAACGQTPCARVCPTGACHPAPLGIGVRVDDGLCIGCRQCVEACPFGAVAMHRQRRTALICDLCDGDPACAANCVAGALAWGSPEGLAEAERRATALGSRGPASAAQTTGAGSAIAEPCDTAERLAPESGSPMPAHRAGLPLWG